MHDAYPHKVIGTKQCLNSIGQLESNTYRDMGIRPGIYELYEDKETKSGRVLVSEFLRIRLARYSNLLLSDKTF
ncbi:hypothetical protein C5O25_09090 [Paramuribaculum intestinale]|uniref:Uncharacterized protein n=1 Tax=Paramuribaculum intestinale TaxID=2094151 RepID=A0A2V1IWT5_9BACT|nr:hypothetical protein C5O25_09090 [Paramuribaculum intestinale]PWB12651.1 hypothetical protein C5O24_01745 [Paramuribaculum intestinale]ROS94445.1 hypothetical protein EEL36_00205 [Muribaculaceae bacterium Isolate-043 (Harlan)]ROT16826.1 hypothetical protein EEL50_03170 [Muribaculaceae bacterium Isolate-105 (HZI)]